MIYDLEKNIKVEDLSGYSYSAIVESYFDTNKYSEELISKLNEYEKLIKENSGTKEDEKQIIELESYLDGIPKELNKELYIKYSELKLEKEQS